MIRQPAKKSVTEEKHKRSKKDMTHAERIRMYRTIARKGKQFGTSKLEERFAREFLDRLGVDYVYQYKAESIGRYYDFRIAPELHGPCIEIDGSYYHADPRLYEGKKLSRMQMKNMRVDEIKNQWCRMNGIKLIRLWEKDINGAPDKVLNYLKLVLKPYLNKTNKA